MTLLADESVDFGIITGLRKMGIPVFSISEECSGISDSEVLKIACKKIVYLLLKIKISGNWRSG
jgi:hypothetical protein